MKKFLIAFIVSMLVLPVFAKTEVSSLLFSEKFELGESVQGALGEMKKNGFEISDKSKDFGNLYVHYETDDCEFFGLPVVEIIIRSYGNQICWIALVFNDEVSADDAREVLYAIMEEQDVSFEPNDYENSFIEDNYGYYIGKDETYWIGFSLEDVLDEGNFSLEGQF